MPIGRDHPDARPVLRLVHPGREADAPAPRETRAPHRPGPKPGQTVSITIDEARIASENRAAAALTPADARWVFAARVATSLEGGRAAVLSPERRERLIAGARTLGLRPFDANLIVAIVQDTARTTGAPLGPAAAERLELVQPAIAPSDRAPAAAWLYPALTSLTLAVALLAILLAWLNN